jgi:hypothetical protein
MLRMLKPYVVTISTGIAIGALAIGNRGANPLFFALVGVCWLVVAVLQVAQVRRRQNA